MFFCAGKKGGNSNSSLLSLYIFYVAIFLNLPLCLMKKKKTSAALYTPFSVAIFSLVYIQPKVCVNSHFFFFFPFFFLICKSPCVSLLPVFSVRICFVVLLLFTSFKKINFSYNFLKLFCELISQSCLSLATLEFPSYFVVFIIIIFFFF